jgi:hypothetical protein
VTKRSQPQWAPQQIGRRGPRGSYDPFYAFEKAARNNGKPYKPPEPKAEQQLLAVIGSKTTLIVMGSVLVIAVVALLVVMVVKL